MTAAYAVLTPAEATIPLWEGDEKSKWLPIAANMSSVIEKELA